MSKQARIKSLGISPTPKRSTAMTPREAQPARGSRASTPKRAYETEVNDGNTFIPSPCGTVKREERGVVRHLAARSTLCVVLHVRHALGPVFCPSVLS